MSAELPPPAGPRTPAASTRLPRALGVIAACYGFLGVAAGAFGAHALRDGLPAARMVVWQTAVDYQLVHALALLAVTLLLGRDPGRRALAVAGVAFAGGVLVFSGSLFALVLADASWLGAVTPVGGTAMLVGWASLAWALGKAPPPRGLRP